ncbi:MAG: helix-turn-helix domain-containing protein [Propionibacteriaceae bacterium]
MSGDLMMLPGAVVVTGLHLQLVQAMCESAIRGNRLRSRETRDSLLELHNAAVNALLTLQRHNDSAAQSFTEDRGVVDPSTYLGMDELAKLLGCSLRTAQRKAHLLDGIKRGGVWLVPKDAVEEHLSGAQMKGGSRL